MEVPVPIERKTYQKWAAYMPHNLFEKVKKTFEEYETLDIVHWFKVSHTVEVPWWYDKETKQEKVIDN